MRTLKILFVLVAVILSGFSRDPQRTEAGVTVPMKFKGVIISNRSAGLTECTPPAVPGQIPLIEHSRTGWLEGNQTHGGKLIAELSTWELFSCDTDFTTNLDTSQIEGVSTVANGDPIPEITDGTQWMNFTSGAYCNYDNNESHAATYGFSALPAGYRFGGGNIDFSTPAEYATAELLPYLTNGKQIIFSECGHVGDVINSNTENTRLILRSFYSTGVANTSLNTHLPMDFTLKMSFPVIAKIGAGVFAFVIIVFGAVIFWFIRLLRKRHAKANERKLEF